MRLFLLEILFCGSVQGFVEVGAEAFCQDVLQELIDADAFAAALGIGGGTDVPAMQIQRQPSSGKFRHPNGIQTARDGLAPPAQTLVETSLYRADGAAVLLKMDIGAFLAAGYGRGDQVPVPVDGKEARAFRLGATLGAHQRIENRILPLDLFTFVLLQRRTAVAFDTADSPADGIIAGKIFSDDVFGNQNVSDLKNHSKITTAHRTMYSTRPADRISPDISRTAASETDDICAL